MLTIIILTSLALVTLIIGFFEIRLPFIYKEEAVKGKKAVKDTPGNIEALYRTIRFQSWFNKIKLGNENSTTGSENMRPATYAKAI